MGFRELFLESIMRKVVVKPTSKQMDESVLAAFSRQKIDDTIQFYLHLKNLGFTFDDLIAHVQKIKDQEALSRKKSALQGLKYVTTREERKRMKGVTRKGRKRREQHDNSK